MAERLLSNLLDGLSLHGACPQHFTVHGISHDSRTVSDGDFYMALPGQRVHGLDFLPQALARGATAVAWDASPHTSIAAPSCPPSVPMIGVEQLKKNLGLIAERFYAAPALAMHVAAVTGTDGKTSVAHFIAQLAAAQWGDCGLIGTLGYGHYDQLRATINTTPDALCIHRTLAELYRAGVRHAAIEASSHGLHQERLSKVHLEVAVLTNLGRDHLDYHGSMNAYADAKMKLFMARPRAAVLNRDDPFSQRVVQQSADRIGQIVFYSLQDPAADIYAESIQCSDRGSAFTVHLFGQAFKVHTKVLGRFNVANMLAAAAVLYLWGVPAKAIADSMNQLEPVPGRLQLLSTAGKAPVIIDYAHTAAALATLLTQCRAWFRGQLYCVFGCGGERDKTKRIRMGQVAAAMADCVILSNDNPRHEDAAAIIDDIQRGVPAACNCRRIHDRHEAIAYALDQAHEGDCVVVAGKGHEQRQIIGDTSRPCSDLAIARSLLGIVAA